jgi:hypothetical protein
MGDLLTTAKLRDHWNDGLLWAEAVLPAQFYSHRGAESRLEAIQRVDQYRAHEAAQRVVRRESGGKTTRVRGGTVLELRQR